MEVVVFDAPAVDHLRVVRVGKVDDVRAPRTVEELDPPDVSVGTVELLLDVDVGDRQARAERQMGDHLHVVAAALLRRPLLRRRGRCGERQDDDGDTGEFRSTADIHTNLPEKDEGRENFTRPPTRRTPHTFTMAC